MRLIYWYEVFTQIETIQRIKLILKIYNEL